MDIKTQRDASRGRKSKAGGEKIKSDSRIYTPAKKRKRVHISKHEQVGASMLKSLILAGLAYIPLLSTLPHGKLVS